MNNSTAALENIRKARGASCPDFLGNRTFFGSGRIPVKGRFLFTGSVLFSAVVGAVLGILVLLGILALVLLAVLGVLVLALLPGLVLISILMTHI